MLKRPKPGEDEEDILRFQEEFLKQTHKSNSLQPATQVVRLGPPQPSTSTNKTSNTSTARKPSKYAQSKGLKSHTAKRPRSDVIGDIIEKNIDESTESALSYDDKVYFPTVIPSLLGSIKEKNIDHSVLFKYVQMPTEGFPVAAKRDSTLDSVKKTTCNVVETTNRENMNKMKIDSISISSTNNTQSIASTSHDDGSFHNDNEQTWDKISNETISEAPLKVLSLDQNIMNVDNVSSFSINMNDNPVFPSKSHVLTSNDTEAIHNENLQTLNQMSNDEILQEQQKLLSSLDPTLIEFIKSKRNSTEAKKRKEKTTHVAVQMDTSDEKTNTMSFDSDSLWENDVLSHPNTTKWLHFDSLEKDKLEWMKGIDENKKVKPDEPYEARFDFSGYLLPYTLEYTEATKSLYHHGDEPHRPGYSLTELFELARSTINQQRVMAINTLAGVLEYYNLGTYKNIIEIPLSKIFFVIRITMDENKIIILEPALKALRNLIFNRIDEASLDALIGFEAGTQQPCLQNDKSELEEIESDESELKDFHLAEIDIIAALLRTDVLQRLYYILDNLKPSFNGVQYSMQILTRLARDSEETAIKIINTDHLMNTIIKHFVPTTSINFNFDPHIVFNGKPILAALKFLRVLSLQSEDIANILVEKYEILKPISQYITSGIDATYGLRIQIEAFCILSNLLNFYIGIDAALSLAPTIVTALYKHVKGTDMHINSSVLSATHAAVVLQTVNRMLRNYFSNLNSFKHQIYPLLKEGVQKWIAQLANTASYSCAHLRVLSAALDCCKTVLLTERIPIKILNDSLTILINSQGFKGIVDQIVPNSNLLSRIENKDLFLTKNLMSLGTSVIDKPYKVLPILNVDSPLPFLVSLYELLECLDNKEIVFAFLQKTTEYLQKLATKTPTLCDNWFTRIETDLVLSIIRISLGSNLSESWKDLIYLVANKLCYILRIDKKSELEMLFANILFNKDWFSAERLMTLVSLSDADGFFKALTSIDSIKMCYCRVINLGYQDTGPNVILKKWQEPILPRDWIYLPILHLYVKSQETETNPKLSKEFKASLAAQKEFIIRSSLEWILFTELCFSDLLQDIDITDRLCRIMCVFVCDNSLFLNKEINLLLNKCIKILFKAEKKKQFNFDKHLMGVHNFQDFFTQFLEQFQSVSYGDHTFAACVLVPLAQKHNVKWRKLLWSEYAGCLRALDCPEAMLCYELNEYFYPLETDESLIKCYMQALSSGTLLRKNSIVHRIAEHHIRNYKNLHKIV